MTSSVCGILDAAGQVGEEHDAGLERGDEERIELPVVGGDLRPQLGDPCRDLVAREVDGADLAVLGVECRREHGLRREAQSVALREALDVAPVEELDPHVRVQPSELA